MKQTKLFAISIILLLSISIFFSRGESKASAQVPPDLYVGVDVAYWDMQAIKQLVDQVSSYTNILVVGCSGITYDVVKLNDMCQYLYDRNMSFIVYTSDPRQPPQDWFSTASSKWGTHFLGIYADDELGGKQLDQAQDYITVDNASSYADAEQKFESRINWFLNFHSLQSNSSTLFTSDYALYWFDYKAGYDTVFAEFGWNYSRQLNVALCRGAATMQNKDWGVIITYTYTTPPYIESAEELYNDMVLAYENGAKYILVFDTDENYSHSILTSEHLDAMKMFWQYAQQNPRKVSLQSDRVAYALPTSYAYGFRGPYDKIWGLWEADSYSPIFSVATDIMLDKYGMMLDIVYEDALQAGGTRGYSNVFYWYDPVPLEDRWPPDMIFPTFPVTSPSPSILPSATPVDTPISTPEEPTASPTLTGSSASPIPLQTNNTSNLNNKPEFPILYTFGLLSGAIAALTLSVIYFVGKKRKSIKENKT